MTKTTKHKSINAQKQLHQPTQSSKGIIGLLQNKWIAIGFIVLISSIVYHNSLNTPFVYDDIAHIVNNPDIRHYTILGTILTSISKDRPLTHFTFSVNYYLGGLETLGYHLFNVSVHMFVAIAVFFLTRKIILYAYKKDSIPFALIVSLLFASHPINTEVVTYVYNRSISLSTLFYLLSLLFFIKTFERNRHLLMYTASLIFFVLSFLSKQTAATLPVVVLIFDYIFLSAFNVKKMKKNYHIPFWGILCVFLVYNYFYFKEGGGQVEISLAEHSYLLTQPWLILKCLSLLIVPRGLSIDHMIEPVTSVFEPRAILPIAAIVLVFLFAWLLHRRKDVQSKIVLFCILWFFVTLLPTTVLKVHFGERHLYLAGLGFYLLLTLVYSQLSVGRNNGLGFHWILVVLAVIHVSSLAVTTIRRNQLYRDPILLWKDVTTNYPKNFWAHGALGVLYKEQGEYDKAFEEYQKAIEINPDYAKAYYNLGNLYYKEKEYSKAIKEYQRAIAIAPAFGNAHNYLGILYHRQKEYTKAIKAYRKALQIDPDYVEAHNNLGYTYYSQKEYNKALQEYQEALEIDPNYDKTHNNLGLLYRELGEYDKAIQKHLKAIEINPDSIDAHYDLGSLYYDQKDYGKALQECESVLELDPYHKDAKAKIEVLTETLDRH